MFKKASLGAVYAASGLLLFTACSSSGGGGISFALLADGDGDGLPDALEASLGSDPADPDSPTPGGAADTDDTFGPGVDALSDALERYLAGTGASVPVTARTDSDLDGVPDYLEVASGLDHLDFHVPLQDGASDTEDNTSSGPSGDGISDALEAYLVGRGTAFPVTADSDTDGDGFTDFLETRVGTNPFRRTSPTFHDVFDVDGDGLPDHFELGILSDPLDGDFPVFHGDRDADGGVNGPDGDALTDGIETYLQRQGVTPPITTLTDSDFDGVPDYIEILAGTNFFDGDDPVADGGLDLDDSTGPADGLSDAMELTLIRGGASAPVSLETDSDLDGIMDYAELLSGSNAFSASSPTLFGHFDLDGDGVPDFLELARKSDPLDGDDPLPDGGDDDDNQLGPPGDRISDAMELVVAQLVGGGAVTTFDDADGDGLSDYIEALLASDPLDPDSPLLEGDQDVLETGPPKDRISDAVESVLISLGSTAPVGDSNNSDSDIVPDFIELLIGSNPVNGFDPVVGQVSDIDGDEAPDYFELLFGSDPTSPNVPLPGGAGDTDRDGLSDNLEELLRIALGLDVGADLAPLDDADGDGLYDYLEAFGASDLLDATSPASTGAGVDNDTNDVTGPGGDGISDALELYLSLGGAPIPVTESTDTDGDFLPDLLEITVVTDPFDATNPFADPQADNDGDGVADALEFVLEVAGVPGEVDAGTDTDGDGAPDYLELLAETDFFDGDDPVLAGSTDADDDGLSEALEAVLAALTGGSRSSQTDSDGDGIPDYFEVQNATNPLLVDHPLAGGGADTNDTTGPRDTISDAFEALLIQLGAAPPVRHGSDTDADGTPDYLEVLAATDAFDALSPVANGNGDDDRDRIRNSAEIVLARLGAEVPVGVLNDTDLDGAPDYVELLVRLHPVNGDDPVPGGNDENFDVNAATGPNGDGISDALELVLLRQGAKAPVGTPTDSDGDGIPDYFEVLIGANPFQRDFPFANGDEDTENSTGPAGDGISDGLEAIILFFAFQSGNPMAQATTTTDIDGDGVPDYIEIFLGTNLIDGTDFPADGVEPEALGLAVSGDTTEGATLTGTYVYFDADDDFEGEPLLRWLRDGAPIAGATSGTYVITADDLGTTLTFEVTPTSLYAWPLSTLTGEPATVSLDVPAPLLAISAGGPGGVGRTDGSSSLTVWLQADAGLSVRDDGEPRVDSWSDRSGHAVQAVAGPRAPSFVSPTPAAPAAVRFGPGDELHLPRTFSEEFTLFAVFRSAADGTLLRSLPGLGERDDLTLEVAGGRPVATVAGSPLSGAADVADGALHSVRTRRTQEALELAVDGALVARTQEPGLAPLTPARLGLGGSAALPGLPSDVCELVTYSRALNDLEQTLVELYLAGRFGGPVVGDLYESLASHGHDVAGIGNDGRNVQAAARGTGPVELSNPSALDPGDYLVFGSNAPSATFSDEAPPGIGARLAQTWAYTLTAATTDGVGTVDVTFLLGTDGAELGGSAEDFRLLIDDDGDFRDARVASVPTRFDRFRSTVTFEGVRLEGGRFFALGLFPGH